MTIPIPFFEDQQDSAQSVIVAGETILASFIRQWSLQALEPQEAFASRMQAKGACAYLYLLERDSLQIGGSNA